MGASNFLKLLSDEQISYVHESALRIIERFGVSVEDAAARDLLLSRGCRELAGRVAITRDFVESALEGFRPSITLRSPAGAVKKLGEGKLLCHSTGGAPWIADSAAGKHRHASMEDLINCVRVMNRMEGLDLPCALVYPSEIPPQITQFVQAATLFRYSEKPVMCPGVSSFGNARYIGELFKMLGNDCGIVGISPESPLFWPKEITDSARVFAELGVPLDILAAPMAGMTAPITTVGCVTMCHAEILAFAAFCGAINPQTPLVYGARAFSANMRTCQVAVGLPETGTASAMSAMLAQKCGLPSDVYGVGCTSCDMDEQAGYEKMMCGLLPALAGADMITGLGSLASVMCGSLEQIVIDDEIVLMIKKICSGYDVSEDTIGFSAIEEALQGDGNFLAEEHTVEHLKKGAVFSPAIGFNGQLMNWIDDGKPPIGEKPRAAVKDIIAEKPRVILDEALDRELHKLTAAAERELVNVINQPF
ncbi:MAG: trimethylamine methyltransferase family protein [Synergistaceae bacterium]|jgi:trimethylamine--corrinoid protein Co-methyltransferase|nr:trimethylamine methyltransferase family protein [Synergistaceae bacterium]